MRKIVHLYKRLAGTDVEPFHRAMNDIAAEDPSVPGLSRYVQSHTLVQGYRKGDLLFDAVEEFSFTDDVLAEDFSKSAIYQSICGRRRDITDTTRNITMSVDVHRVKDKPVPAGAIKNIEFVNRRPGMEIESFQRYWREVHGPLGSTIPSILRYEQNHVTRDSYAGAASPRYDGLAITWFESTAAMRSGAETAQYSLTRADEANFLPDGHLPIIIVREVLDRNNFPTALAAGF